MEDLISREFWGLYSLIAELSDEIKLLESDKAKLNMEKPMDSPTTRKTKFDLPSQTPSFRGTAPMTLGGSHGGSAAALAGQRTKR